MKRLVWKEGGVVSFKLKEELYTIGQMLKNPYFMFFKLTSEDGSFEDIDLNEIPMLFIIPVVRDFVQKRAVEKIKKGVVPKENPQLPVLWIQARDCFQCDYPWKGGDLVKIDPEAGDLGISNPVVQRDIDPADTKILEQYELTHIWTDKFLTARLILSLERGKNIDPLKEKIFFGTDAYGLFE